MKTYTIIAGVNGVGKSSLAGVLKAERSDLGCVIDVDKIAADKPCSAVEAGKIAVAKIDGLLSRDISFTQETTLSGKRTERTVRAAKDKGYFVRLFYIGLSSREESKKRIRNRVEKGGHNVPEADVDRRFSGRFEALARILPYCDEALFFDNENGFVEVGEYKNGEVIAKGEYAPPWMRELSDTLKGKM